MALKKEKKFRKTIYKSYKISNQLNVMIALEKERKFRKKNL